MGRVFINFWEKELFDFWDMGCVIWEDSLEVGGKFFFFCDLECLIVVFVGIYVVCFFGNSFYFYCV